MELYLGTFQGTRYIFLEFCTTKTTRAEEERQGRELKEQIANADRSTGSARSTLKQPRPLDEAEIGRTNQ